MFHLSGHHLGDTWFYAAEDCVHMFFLCCVITVPRHTRWNIGHATSTDLIAWEYQGLLFYSQPDQPHRSCLSTGSVVRRGDRYLMSFLGNHNQPNPGIVLAESFDLFHWRELPPSHCSLQESGYSRRASKPFKNPRWRDPFLFIHEGWLYQLMTAASESLPENQDGVVAVMRTNNLVRWEFLPPLRTPPIGTDLECPKLHLIDGRWHLLVSLFNVLHSPDFAAIQPPELNSSTSFSLVADSLTGVFHFHGDARILSNDTPGCPYACNAVPWRGEWFLLGTCWSDRLGDRISDPIPLQVTQAGFRSP